MNYIYLQFIHGNLPPIRREILLNVLKVAQNQGRFGPLPQGRGSPPSIAAHSNSVSTTTPHSSSQHLNISPTNLAPPGGGGGRISPSILSRCSPVLPISDPIQQLLLQQQQNKHQSQAQQRLSPMFTNLQGQQPGGKNTLSISPVPNQQQRVPSPQELVLHTQQIMQNALIKRKLEEQKENYRRRQDPICGQAPAAFRDRSCSDSQGNSGGARDSPLAFTPMSVMKKMAADRRDSDPKLTNSIPELKVSQEGFGSEISHGIGPAGDETMSSRPNPSGDQSASHFNQMAAESGEIHSHQLGGSPISGMLPHIPLPPLSQGPPNNQQFSMHLHHAQQAAVRAQHLQSHWANNPFPPPSLGPVEHHLLMQQQAAHHGHLPAHLGFPGQFPGHHPGQMAAAVALAGVRPQNLGIPTSLNAHGSTSPSTMGFPGQGGLAKFFSPEILAQAQSGNAPSMPPLPTQKALTLEEIERQAAAVRI